MHRAEQQRHGQLRVPSGTITHAPSVQVPRPAIRDERTHLLPGEGVVGPAALGGDEVVAGATRVIRKPPQRRAVRRSSLASPAARDKPVGELLG